MVESRQDLIRELCTAQSFQRGLRYFEEGRVKIVEASSSRIVAKVVGKDNYRVEVDLDHLSAVCNCPYDLEGYCKHIVAVFMAVDREPEKVNSMIDECIQELEKMSSLLKNADPDELDDFFRRELGANAELRSRFLARFSAVGEGRSLSSYKDEIESRFEEAEDEHGLIYYDNNLDFESFQNLAEIYIQKNDLLEAAKIYQALTEKISEKMDHVDDSDGYYGGVFSHSLEAFVECIKNAGLDAEARRKYIDYLFQRYLLRDPDYFQDDYFDALKELCSSKEDLQFWNNRLASYLPVGLADKKDDPSSHYRDKERISMRLYLLSRLNETSNFYALMDENYRSSSDLCLQYAKKLLENKDRSKAIKIAEEGIALFPEYSSRYLREFLRENYRETDNKKYRAQLLSLFLLTWEWKYYEQLKAAVKKEEWKETLDDILANVATKGMSRTKLIDIYLKERMFDAALEEVMAQKSIHSLRAYHGKLANLYPMQYFAAYKELIHPYAESRLGREHYRDVVAILKNMVGIKGFESEAEEIIERLRMENKRKPAFIDELKGL